MAKLPQISDAEWDVIKVLWDRGEAGAQEVTEALAVGRNWRPQTVKTLLNRLVKKGAVPSSRDSLYNSLHSLGFKRACRIPSFYSALA